MLLTAMATGFKQSRPLRRRTIAVLNRVLVLDQAHLPAVSLKYQQMKQRQLCGKSLWPKRNCLMKNAMI